MASPLDRVKNILRYCWAVRRFSLKYKKNQEESAVVPEQTAIYVSVLTADGKGKGQCYKTATVPLITVSVRNNKTLIFVMCL